MNTNVHVVSVVNGVDIKLVKAICKNEFFDEAHSSISKNKILAPIFTFDYGNNVIEFFTKATVQEIEECIGPLVKYELTDSAKHFFQLNVSTCESKLHDFEIEASHYYQELFDLSIENNEYGLLAESECNFHKEVSGPHGAYFLQFPPSFFQKRQIIQQPYLTAEDIELDSFCM